MSQSTHTHTETDGGIITGGIRGLLTAARTYYVRTDGSDSNTGLVNNASGAFLTIQKGINVVAALDLSIYDATIQIGAGTYAEALVCKQCVGAGTVYILGNTTTPANVVISGAQTISSNGVTTQYNIQGVRSTGATGFILAQNGGRIDWGNCTIANAGIHIYVLDLSEARAMANYTIAAGGTAHWYTANCGVIRAQGYTITLTGTPAFSTAFAKADVLSNQTINGDTFSGSATGTRYVVSLNSIMLVAGGGATYLPGDVAGTTSLGGQYA